MPISRLLVMVAIPASAFSFPRIWQLYARFPYLAKRFQFPPLQFGLAMLGRFYGACSSIEICFLNEVRQPSCLSAWESSNAFVSDSALCLPLTTPSTPADS